MINVTQTFLPPLEEFNTYLERIWKNKWLTNRGELVNELEERLKSQLGVSNLLIVNNGTIALQIAIKALELSGEIITTPFSYVATTSSIIWEGCSPIFVDIDPSFLTIDETKIEAAITDKTSAILATHIYGNPCNVEVIQAIADKYNLKVIYDAAHCFGVKYLGESILNWGDVSTLSFHATKLFHTAEGGAIICRNPEITHKVYYMHNFGHNINDTFWGLGINAKVCELNAAMGLSVFPYIDEISRQRKEICELYDKQLAETDLKRPSLRANTTPNYSYYPVLFPSEFLLLKTLTALAEEAINARRYFYPSLTNLPYVADFDTPVSEDISKRVLCLPLYAGLADNDVIRISGIIKNCLVP